MSKRSIPGWQSVKGSLSPWPFLLLAIFLCSLKFYGPTLQGDKIWDDDDLVSGAAFGKNTFISAFTKPFLGHYFRPLTSASFVMDSSFAKQTPFFYHQTNIVLHALTAVLIACLAVVITKRMLAGVLAGVFFATQPMQVGAAGWIGGRTDVLSAFFLAAFMVCLVQYYHSTYRKPWLVAAVLSYFLAALSKEQALAILPAVPLAEFAFGTKKWKDALKLCIPFASVLVLYVILWMIDAPAPVGAKTSIFYAITLALRTAAHYGLAVLTPNDPSLLTFTLNNYQGVLWILVGVVLVGGFLWFVKWSWKDHRPLTWLAICAWLVYMPISNFPVVPSFVVGPYRFAEAGTAAACLLGIACAYGLSRRRWWLGAALGANLVAATAVSWWGLQQWSTPIHLFDTVAHIDPHFLIGVGNYAHALDLEHKPEEEVAWTQRTLTWVFGTDKWFELLAKEKENAFTPDVVARLQTNNGIPDKKALGWFISGNAAGLASEHKIDQAIAVEREALMVGPKDPRIHFSYANLILDRNRPEAIRHYEIALKLNSTFSVCAAALAHERVVDGRYAEAVALLSPIMDQVGWDSRSWIDLAKAKMGLHDLAGASMALDEASHTLFVKKDEIEACRKQIRALMQAGKHAGG